MNFLCMTKKYLIILVISFFVSLYLFEEDLKEAS